MSHRRKFQLARKLPLKLRSKLPEKELLCHWKLEWHNSKNSLKIRKYQHLALGRKSFIRLCLIHDTCSWPARKENKYLINMSGREQRKKRKKRRLKPRPTEKVSELCWKKRMSHTEQAGVSSPERTPRMKGSKQLTRTETRKVCSVNINQKLERKSVRRKMKREG